jgi:hypothetical protein
VHRPHHCVYWTETRITYISTCHWENRRKNEYPDSQDLAERFHGSLGLGGRKKNEITEDYPERGGNKTEEQAHCISSNDRSSHQESQKIDAGIRGKLFMGPSMQDRAGARL